MDQAFDLFHGTVLASHHNCRALVDRQRQLRDRRHRPDRRPPGGVIGTALDAWMLDIDCPPGDRRAPRNPPRSSHRGRPDRPRLPAHRLGPSCRALAPTSTAASAPSSPPTTSTRSPTSPGFRRSSRRRGYSDADIHGNHARELARPPPPGLGGRPIVRVPTRLDRSCEPIGGQAGLAWRTMSPGDVQVGIVRFAHEGLVDEPRGRRASRVGRASLCLVRLGPGGHEGVSGWPYLSSGWVEQSPRQKHGNPRRRARVCFTPSD